MFHLRSKIVLSFFVIILTGSILMVSIINYSTRIGYQNFTKRNDKLFLERLISPLENYYSLSNSWVGVEDFLEFPKGRMRDMMDNRSRNPYPSIILTTKTGNIILSSNNNIKKINKDLLNKGLTLKNNNEVVGLVFTSSMLTKNFTPEEEYFLNKIKTIIIYVTLGILIISVIFSYIFSSRLTRPITKLSEAAIDIKAGNYKVRVKPNGNDEIGQLQESFNSMAESIERSDNWRKRIIADSAHELRTPVTLIQGNLELILEDVYKADKTVINGIYQETKVLSRLIKELQELSSAESGTLILNKEDLNLNEFINNTIEMFIKGNRDRDIKLINNVHDPLPTIKADVQKLKQVLINILSNSYRYTPNGGEIEINCTFNKEFVSIKVKDTGIGIKEEDLEKIFERFFRTDTSRNRESGGRGLGLAISREIIKLHNGTIVAKSRENLGTTIIITLPINPQ